MEENKEVLSGIDRINDSFKVFFVVVILILMANGGITFTILLTVFGIAAVVYLRKKEIQAEKEFNELESE